MINIDSFLHLSGRSCYIDDFAVPADTLYGAVVYSEIAHGTIQHIDTSAALVQAGVVAILSAKDIPGENQIGGIIPDEPLLAEGTVHYFGQPIVLILATSLHEAQAARKRVKVQIDPLPVISDPRLACAEHMLIMPPRTMQRGEVKKALGQCATVVQGKAESGGQEHLYLETQGAIALPQEGSALKIISSTQGPTAVQKTVSRILGIARHLIEVEVGRLGGGFGGKEDQASAWAALAALGAYHTGKAVKLVLPRHDDMRMTGKRHPYSSDYTIGIDEQGLILAFTATYYQNAGAAADLSPAVLARTLFHATNCYHIPNVALTGYSCRTHLPPNTAFRGFGGPQGMFVIESALRHAAEAAGLDAIEVQRLNLLSNDRSFHYGQKVQGCHAVSSWERCYEGYQVAKQRVRISEHNKSNHRLKKGMAMMPICFGISFTNTPMNQAGALVHIYGDGSVAVSTAAVEMGQGVSTKIAQVAAETLGIPVHLVRVLSTTTSRIANTSPTAASAAADLNGKATQKACLALRARLDAIAQECAAQQLSWQQLIETAYLRRCSLSEHAYYATPDLHWDEKSQSGKPFAYHVYGTAYCEVSVDILKGTYSIDKVQLVHDAGTSMNREIDRGQIEGGLLQGIGWLTVEELLFSPEGKPLTDTLSTYKVPDIYHGPRELEVEFLDNSAHESAILNSKAVGEPPLMYGIGVFFALREALRAAKTDKIFPFIAPLTPERVFMQLHGE
jgi:xanthine dehydrogenase large subunit